MANPGGTTVQSSMAENLEIAKILEVNRCPKTWVHFDLSLMTNGSKKTRSLNQLMPKNMYLYNSINLISIIFKQCLNLTI